MDGRRSETLGWVSLIAVWFLWGSTYDAIRVGVRDMPPLLLAGTRYLIAAAILLPFAARGARITRAHWRGAAIAGGLMLLGGNGLLCISEKSLPAGVAALLVGTVPLWLVVLDAFVNRRMIRPLAVAGLVIGLAGVAILVRPDSSQRFDPWAVGLVLLGSAFWAAGSLYSKTAPQPSGTFLGTGMQMLTGGFFLVAASGVTGEWGDIHMSGDTVLALLWLAVPGSIIAYTAYIYALKVLPTSTTSTYAYVNPVVAVLLGWPLLGERPTGQTAIAGVVIVAAVALILRSSTRAPAPAAPRPATEKAAR